MSERILIVEDEDDIAIIMQHCLKAQGYKADICADGIKALQWVRSAPPDLMLLDIMLPGIDGKDLCRAIRRDFNFPIIIVSARTTEVDKVIGLELGADDYLAKPFGTLELIARVRSALRRASGDTPARGEIMNVGDITLDNSRHEVIIAGHNIDLRPKEFSLLEYLMANKGRVVTRDILLDRIWGEDEYIDKGTVDVHIHRLREKIENDPGKPHRLLTVRGVGYKIVD